MEPQLQISSCSPQLISERKSRSIIEKYNQLKFLADEINRCMSPILFFYVFEAIFYYATNLNVIFTAQDWYARLQVVHFLLGCASVFGFSADVTRKVSESWSFDL